jgi:hypothetical protein
MLGLSGGQPSYRIGGSDGRAATEGKGIGVLIVGGTDGSGLSSWRTVSIAEFSLTVEPGGSAAAPSPFPPEGEGNAELASFGAVTTVDPATAVTGAGARRDGCGVGLELPTATSITGTRATAASRAAANGNPPPGRC